MAITLNQTRELMPEHVARRAIDALEHDERTESVFADDPMMAISLAQAVHNFLYSPSDFTLGQLIGHHADLVSEIEEHIGADEEDDDSDGED